MRFEVAWRDPGAGEGIHFDEITQRRREGLFSQHDFGMFIQLAVGREIHVVTGCQIDDWSYWGYGALVAAPEVQAVLCQVIMWDEDSICNEGPYEDGSVLLYGNGFSLSNLINGALLMRKCLRALRGEDDE